MRVETMDVIDKLCEFNGIDRAGLTAAVVLESYLEGRREDCRPHGTKNGSSDAGEEGQADFPGGAPG